LRQLLLHADKQIGAWMAEMLAPCGFTEGRGIGVVDVLPEMQVAKIIAGIWYESYNGANISMHVAALPNSRWMSKELLWYAFYYPFIECGCKRVTGLVAESNMEAREFDERLGFKIETRLRDAAPDGDLLVYAMFRDECRWLGLRDRVAHLRNRMN